jgi:hypothetical protein
MLLAGLGGGAALVAADFADPQAALAEDARANPIPGGLAMGVGFHVNSNAYSTTDPPAFDDQSAITDFDGLLASSHIQGTGRGHDPRLGDLALTFDADMRVMQGTYRAVDGLLRHATFGFI